jgi:O-acetylhomoserine/O-acetylserine sulfhydrylase-like pyridoxal-dependent enzyme
VFNDTRTIGKKPSKRVLNQIDRKIEAIYYKHCARITIKVMDIGKVFEAGRVAALAGLSDEAITSAVLAKVAELRQDRDDNGSAPGFKNPGLVLPMKHETAE